MKLRKLAVKEPGFRLEGTGADIVIDFNTTQS